MPYSCRKVQCRGKHVLLFAAASAAACEDFPTGALFCITGSNTIVYAPMLASQCHAFAFGSLGYIQMCMECLRMLVYLVIGYVLPAICQQARQYVTREGLEAWQQGTARSATPGATTCSATLQFGADPGLWACRQCFGSSWHRFCVLRMHGSAAQPQLNELCARCQSDAACHVVHPANALCVPLVRTADDAAVQPDGACLTSAAAVATLVHTSAIADQRPAPGQPAMGAAPAVLLHRGNVRGGATLHDEPTTQHLQELTAHVQDHLAPQPEQVARVGTFRPLRSCSCSGGSSAGARAPLFADLRSQHWGACVDANAAMAELAERQGNGALVPGPLGDGGSPAFFYVPGFAHSSELLQHGLAALQECQRVRIWAGCHR